MKHSLKLDILVVTPEAKAVIHDIKAEGIPIIVDGGIRDVKDVTEVLPFGVVTTMHNRDSLQKFLPFLIRDIQNIFQNTGVRSLNHLQ